MSLANSKVCIANSSRKFAQTSVHYFFILYFIEKEHQKQLERARKEQRKAERGELRTEQEQHEESDSAIDTKDIPQQSEQPAAVAAMHNEGVVRAAHSMTHDVSHSEPVRKFTLIIKLIYKSSYILFSYYLVLMK